MSNYRGTKVPELSLSQFGGKITIMVLYRLFLGILGKEYDVSWNS